MPKRLIIMLASALLAGSGTMISLVVSAGSQAQPIPFTARVVSSGTSPYAPGVTGRSLSHAAQVGDHSATVTDNWGGYIATSGANAFTRAQAVFVVPSLASCAPAENSSSVFWVGLDGWQNGTVEQAGVAADCNGGVPQYFAWWENVPLNSGIFSAVQVHPGDVVHAAVSYQGNSQYQLHVDDRTNDTGGTTTVSLPGAQNSSAECIAEDPSGANALLPYANFGTVSFSNCTVNNSPIGNYSPLSANTVNSQGTVVASTSALTGGTAFTVSRNTSTPAVTVPSPSPNGLATPVVGLAATPTGDGYWLANAYGGILPEGGAISYGSMAGAPLNSPIVHVVATSDGKGYWLVAGDGGTFAFGDAAFYGSMGGKQLNAPIVDIAPTPDGKGYWLVARDGGVFAFGDAAFLGSMGGTLLNKPVVGISADKQTGGYWMVASDGGIFAFRAPFFGSTASLTLNSPVLSMAPGANGAGYLMVAGDGGTFAFGDAAFHGSMGGQSLSTPIVDIDSDPSTGGYWMVNSAGSVYSFGAPFYGSA